VAVTTATTRDIDAIAARFAKIGYCTSPRWSPDGSRIVFVSDLSGVPQAWTIDAAGGWPTRITAFDDPVLFADWSPTGDRISVVVAPGGGLNMQVHTLTPSGADVRRLTDGGKENNRSGPWTWDGTRVLIGSKRRDPASIDTYVVDVTSNEWREVARTVGISAVGDVSRDGRHILLGRVRERGDSDLYVVDLSGGEERHLTPHSDRATFGNPRFSPDGRHVYFITNSDREFTAFVRRRIDGSEIGPIEVLAAADHDVDAFALTYDGTRAAVLWNVDGRAEIEILDIALGRTLFRPALPVDLVGGIEWSRDGTRLAFSGNSVTTTTDLYVLDSATRQIRRITWSPHPGVDLDRLQRPTLERFRAHDGLDLCGWLYLPRDWRPPGPVVLSFHGGPEGQERPGPNRTYQILLELGIGVFAPNIRGSTGFGKTFVHLDDGHKRFDAIRDAEASVRHVVERGIADPARIGITGGSYGGYMTMVGITEFPDLFAAAVCVCGIVNFRTFFAKTESWMAAISKSEYGDPVADGDLLDRLSPIHKMDRVRTPTLVLHGANDTNCPVVEAEQMVAEIGQRGVPVELVMFPDEGHGFIKTANRVRAAIETARWFDRYLNA
jgi:dipeptidyl aminopeptidase/acylaminoacyl peptidase